MKTIPYALALLVILLLGIAEVVIIDRNEYSQGYTDGQKQGYTDGYNTGYNAGREQDTQSAYNDGYAQGMAFERDQMMHTLVGWIRGNCTLDRRGYATFAVLNGQYSCYTLGKG